MRQDALVAGSMAMGSLYRREAQRVAHGGAARPGLLEVDGREDGDDAVAKRVRSQRGARVGDVRASSRGGDEQIDAEVTSARRVAHLRPAGAQLVHVRRDAVADGRLADGVVRTAADVHADVL